jgi:hypothetical protein
MLGRSAPRGEKRFSRFILNDIAFRVLIGCSGFVRQVPSGSRQASALQSASRNPHRSVTLGSQAWRMSIAAQGSGGADDDWLVGNVWAAGKAELKNRAAGHIGLCRQSAPMRFDDRAANR